MDLATETEFASNRSSDGSYVGSQYNQFRNQRERNSGAHVFKWASPDDIGFIQGVRVVRYYPARPDHHRLVPTFPVSAFTRQCHDMIPSVRMEAARDRQSMRPEIVENYKDFEAPANFRKLLDDLLEAVPAKYLVGLKTIVLANQSALTRDQRRQKIWSRNRKVRLKEARG